MMICVAEGVDRFNGDPESLLKDAARRIAAGPLVRSGALTTEQRLVGDELGEDVEPAAGPSS